MRLDTLRLPVVIVWTGVLLCVEVAPPPYHLTSTEYTQSECCWNYIELKLITIVIELCPAFGW